MERTKRIFTQGGTNSEWVTEDANTSLCDYDVFLSFRGLDTRRSFTDVLYDHMSRAGLRVFLDDEELALGDMINKILPAIDKSRVCIPIFSKRFASSKWCLYEVTRMVESEKEIVPIFYDVTPEDVKLKTTVYKKFMDEHMKNNNKNEVEKWEKALKSVATIKGKEVRDTSYTEFCKSFVEEILVKLPRRKFEMDPVIGQEEQVQSVMQLLDIGSTDMRYIGIYGMGGIGKTTLAKDIFNKIAGQFESSSFLEDVRELFGRYGVEYLLEKLLKGLNPTSARQFDLSRMMEECFRRKKVLVVLDDADQWEQIEKLAGKAIWFGSGSRIIVTTRNMSIMKTGYGKISEDKVRHFEMEPLGHGNALQLFNRHAFKEGIIAVGFEELSKKVAFLTGGLPLALKIIGSFLYNKKRDRWEEIIEKLKEIPESKVMETLKISYDALEPEQQQIFLDIACFFVGEYIIYPIVMWRACKFYPLSGLEVLHSMSLVKVSNDGIIQMHNQLRDLGREIVRRESINHPTKRSRLWEDERARQVLMSKKDNETVEALRVEGYCAIDLTQAEVGSIENLRFLELQLANLKGDFEGILPNLRWLSYHNVENFEATNFAMTSLVILDFSCSTISDSWGGWSQLKIAKNLKVLDLSGSMQLTRTPYFPTGMALERLVLEHCCQLEAIDVSIGNLNCLRILNLKECHSLTGLPDSIEGLVKLEHLFLGSCKALKKLPHTLGTLNSLVALDLSRSGLVELPPSVGELARLQRLRLSHCFLLEKLPDSLGNIRSLVELDLTFTGIFELPESIGGLENLRLLSLLDCSKINALPEAIGHLKSLVILELSRTGIRELPESIGRLENLGLMGLEHCPLKMLPKSFGALKKLEILNAESTDLSGLLNEISGILSLTALFLSHSRVCELPSSINQMHLLHKLCLSQCHLLQDLPDLPVNLKVLHVSSRSLHRVHHLSELRNLTALTLGCGPRSSDSDFGISMLSQLVDLHLVHPALTALPNEFGNLTQLKKLTLFCPNLKSAPQLPLNIEEMYLSGVKQDIDLPNLSDLMKLSLLEVKDWLVGGTLGICLPKSLMNLFVINCPHLESLPEISVSDNLRNLHLLYCYNLLEIPGLGKSKKLQYLIIQCCHYLVKLENLSELKHIQNVRITCCWKLGTIEGVDASKISIHGRHSPEMHVNVPKLIIDDEHHDISSLLSSPGRDFLIQHDGQHFKIDCLNGKKVLLYIFEQFWETFNTVLSIAYRKLYPPGDFEVVFVSANEAGNEESFNSYFHKMPWKAVPLSDLGKRRSLYKLLRAQGHRTPRLVILDENGKVVTNRGFEIIGAHGEEAHPFTSKRIKELKCNVENYWRNQSLTSIFVYAQCDFITTNDGSQFPVSKLEGEVVGIYLSSSSYEECNEFTSTLREVYWELKAKGQSFEIVWAPIEANQDSFRRTFRTVPWFTLSSGWFQGALRLHLYFNVSTLPTLVIIGADGKTLQPNVAGVVEKFGAKAYPFTLEKLQRLVISACREFAITNRGEQVHAPDLVGKNILLYFSAHRVLPSRTFLPKLIEAYREIKVRDDAFEVLFISNDEDEASFHEYFSAMPWLALPFGDERIHPLYDMLEVRQLSQLVVIGLADRIITKEAIDLIVAYGSDAYPFTDEHIDTMVNSWPHKFSHAFHQHELVLARRKYKCDGCNLNGDAWSYCCKGCDFDLHPKCALAEGKWETPEK